MEVVNTFMRMKNKYTINQSFTLCIKKTCLLGIGASRLLALNSLRRRYINLFLNWGLGAQTGLVSRSLQTLVLSFGKECNLWPVSIHANRRLFRHRSRHVFCAEPDDLAHNCLS